MRIAILFAIALPLAAQTISGESFDGAFLRDTRRVYFETNGLSTHQVPSRNTTLRISQVFLLAGASADIASSWGQRELNPILGQGTFGARQVVVSAGITGALMLVEGPIVRKWPEMRKSLTVLNYVIGGLRFGVAARNWELK